MDTIVSEATISPTDTGAATFTKWLVGEGPEMAGTVGGSVGKGTYAGKVLEMIVTALVHVEQTGLEAVIGGVVIDGWGKGRPVTGSYTEIQCSHDGVTTDCWQGRLEIAGAG